MRETKDYLAGRIAEEAERAGTPLTEVERKMLYFSETGWTPSGMEAAIEEFDRAYDEDEYERKIGRLVCAIEARHEVECEEREAWDDAVLKLSEGDEYLLGLIIDAAGSQKWRSLRNGGRLRLWLPTLDGREPREPGDLKRLILVALGFAVVFFLVLLVAALFHA